MVKIGKSFLNVFVLSLLCIIGQTNFLKAQASVDVSATVTESEVFTGDYITLKIEVKGSGFKDLSRPILPSVFPGFKLASTTPSISRSMSIINGKSSTSYGYAYTLIAQDKGAYKIPSISIEVDNQVYRTKELVVRILDREAAAADGSNQPDIFLRLEVDNNKPVVGEQIIVNVDLYFKNNIEVHSFAPRESWKAEGFWKEKLDNKRQPQVTSLIRKGVKYKKATLSQYALFPTKSGKLTLSPFLVAVSMRTMSRENSPFGSILGGFGGNQRNVNLTSNDIRIEVSPVDYPTDAINIGAVGELQIERTISTQQTKVGESIEVITKVSGTGNIPILTKPTYELPDNVEVYEPEENTVLNKGGKKVYGVKTFTELLIPRTQGELLIPEAKIAYYDTKANRVKELVLNELKVNILPDDRIVADAAIGSSSSIAIKPILGLATWVFRTDTTVWDGFGYWFICFLPLAIVGGAFVFKVRTDKLNSDEGFARSVKAFDKSLATLEIAKQQAELNQVKEAYGNIHQALAGFIADKVSAAEAGWSDDEIVAHLEKTKVDADSCKQVLRLLKKCSTIRYAPVSSKEDMLKDLELATSLLKTLKKAL